MTTRETPRVIVGVACAIALALATSACNFFGNDSTSPSSSTAPEIFAGTLTLKNSSLYTFTVAQTGTVSITLTSLTPTPVAVELGLGTPNGPTSCNLTSSNPTAVAGTTPQISVTENPGSYCVAIYDVGNLTTVSMFSISIAHS